MKKRGQVWDTLIPWLIGIGVLVFFIILVIILNGAGTDSLNYFKTLFRFGR